MQLVAGRLLLLNVEFCLVDLGLIGVEIVLKPGQRRTRNTVANGQVEVGPRLIAKRADAADVAAGRIELAFRLGQFFFEPIDFRRDRFQILVGRFELGLQVLFRRFVLRALFDVVDRQLLLGGLHLVEGSLESVPFAGMIGAEHPDRHRKQGDRSERENDVHFLDVA